MEDNKANEEGDSDVPQSISSIGEQDKSDG